MDAGEPPGSVGPGFCAWPADMLPAPEVYGDLLLVGDSSLQCGWKAVYAAYKKKKSVDLWVSVCAHEPRWSRRVCLWVLEHLGMYVDVPESVFIKFIKCSVQAACIIAQCLSK